MKILEIIGAWLLTSTSEPQRLLPLWSYLSRPTCTEQLQKITQLTFTSPRTWNFRWRQAVQLRFWVKNIMFAFRFTLQSEKQPHRQHLLAGKNPSFRTWTVGNYRGNSWKLATSRLSKLPPKSNNREKIKKSSSPPYSWLKVKASRTCKALHSHLSWPQYLYHFGLEALCTWNLWILVHVTSLVSQYCHCYLNQSNRRTQVWHQLPLIITSDSFFSCCGIIIIKISVAVQLNTFDLVESKIRSCTSGEIEGKTLYGLHKYL